MWMNDDGTVFGVYKGGCDRCGHRVRFDYVHEHAGIVRRRTGQDET